MSSELILVPAGEFLMSEGDDVHSVYVPAFYIAKYPVTNAAYQVFIRATRYRPPPHFEQRHVDAALGGLPGRFGAHQPTTNYRQRMVILHSLILPQRSGDSDGNQVSILTFAAGCCKL